MATSSRPQILRFRSDNSSYTAGDTIRIEIPTNRQGHYIFPQESFLEFTFLEFTFLFCEDGWLDMIYNPPNAIKGMANSIIYTLVYFLFCRNFCTRIVSST